MASWSDSRFVLELAFPNLGRESFGCGNFRETGALRRVSLVTRVAKNCGKLASFAACCWDLFLRNVCYRNLLLPSLRRENFGTEKFGEALALHSVSIATREAQNCGKLVGFAVCLWDLLSPTWAVKVLDAEIFAKQGRYAAFHSRRGRPKIVVR